MAAAAALRTAAHLLLLLLHTGGSQTNGNNAAAIAAFGAAGHFAYQQPYGRDNQPFSAWPINTTEQLRVLKKACGGARAKRRCIYKTDFPCGPGTFNTTDNSSDPHLQYLLRSTMPHRSIVSCAFSDRQEPTSNRRSRYMRQLAAHAAAMDIEIMAVAGIGPVWGAVSGGVGPEEYGRRMAAALHGTGIVHWQVSGETCVSDCMLPRVDYKTHFGMEKADYNASCMVSWCSVMAGVIRGIHSVNSDAVAMPISMGWTRLGIWQWIADEKVPLDAIGLDWYSDGGDINCTCTEYLPDKCGQQGHKPCLNMLAELGKILPGKPIWITEVRKRAFLAIYI
jgi:hypothetical protein